MERLRAKPKLRDTIKIRVEDVHPEDPRPSFLEKFHPPDKDARVRADVIFVPGLGGDFVGTWAAVDGTVWPRDLLRHHLNDIRIFSFSYNTTLFGTTNDLKLRENANDLVWHILEDREDDEAAMLRPLVFVGHSLGGLLIKRAIKAAYDKPNLRPIWEASRGVMFFASPQHDMDSRTWPIFADRVLRCVAPRKSEGQKPTGKMLKMLEDNRASMMKTAADFKPLQSQLAFATLLETDTMDGYDRVLVSEAHGLIHDPERERHCPLSGDHLKVCTFDKEDRDEAPFGTVWQYIKWLIDQTPKEIDKLTYEERRALFSLCAEEFHRYFDREPTPETCAWIVNTSEFKTWLNDESENHKLWIKGPPGCGKSYLARHIIVNTVIDRKSHEIVHCFLSSSAPGRGDLRALLRSTLHQALRAAFHQDLPVAPDLVRRFLLPTFKEWQKRDAGDQNLWSEEFVKGIWADAMAEVTARHPLAFVIDGFDEADEGCRTGFLDCLRDLEAKSGPEGPKFKLLVLSREDPELEAELSRLGFVSLMVTPKDTKEDIRRTAVAGLAIIWRTLGQTAPDKAGKREIYDTITQQSGGVHLWAALAVQYLGRIRVENGADLQDKIKELPPDIKELYGKMLGDVFSRKRFVPFAKQVLMWVMLQRWRLKTAEFNFAQALGLAMREHEGPTVPTHKDLQEFLEDNIEIKVDHCCGHLAKFQGGRLEWVHGSLLLYLLDQGDERSILAGLGLEKLPYQAAMAQACIVYLNMEYFADSGAPREPDGMGLWEAKVRRRVREHPFVRYAALNWRAHLENAGAAAWQAHSGNAERHARSMRWRELLLDPESEHAKSWSEVWWFFTRGPSEDYPDGCLAALAAAHRKAASDLDEPWTAPPQGTEAETPREEALAATHKEAAPDPDKPSTAPPQETEMGTSLEKALVAAHKETDPNLDRPSMAPPQGTEAETPREEALVAGHKQAVPDPDTPLAAPPQETEAGTTAETALASTHKEAAPDLNKPSAAPPQETEAGTPPEEALDFEDAASSPATSPSSTTASVFSEFVPLSPVKTPASDVFSEPLPMSGMLPLSSRLATPRSREKMPQEEASDSDSEDTTSNLISPGSEAALSLQLSEMASPNSVTTPDSETASPSSNVAPPSPATAPGSDTASPPPEPTSMSGLGLASSRPATHRSAPGTSGLKDGPPRSRGKKPQEEASDSGEATPNLISPGSKAALPLQPPEVASPSASATPGFETASPSSEPTSISITLLHSSPQIVILNSSPPENPTPDPAPPPPVTTSSAQPVREHIRWKNHFTKITKKTDVSKVAHSDTMGWRQRVGGAAKTLAKAGKGLAREVFEIGDKERRGPDQYVKHTHVTTEQWTE